MKFRTVRWDLLTHGIYELAYKWDFSIYGIVEQHWLSRVCADVQIRQRSNYGCR